ncbi:uncharacterized protein PAC_09670 [Phialocephala subalpina]|uniref:NACHT domain-containing protein n=1 Tax=Phialocephala subalpina TaxID=576137 RepID=A0A1L7X434_9HELO|nr:uncharacterized protein PAC_09670 [Phialocephala subalpina]
MAMPVKWAKLYSKAAGSAITLLVDGLDEFDDDHEDLARLLTSSIDLGLSSIKFCVPSRPLMVFKDTFDAHPQLQLQNLTFNDIERYTEDKFNENTAYRRLKRQESDQGEKLIREIVKKADDLWNRLRSLLEDLELLYEHLMHRIEPIYRVWASKALQVTRAVHEMGTKTRPKAAIITDSLSVDDGFDGDVGLNLLELYLAVNGESIDRGTFCSLSPEAIIAKCQQTEVHLTARNMNLGAGGPGMADLRSEATNILVYASYADADTESHALQTRFLDETDDLMTKYTFYGNQWFRHMEHMPLAEGMVLSFKDFALFLLPTLLLEQRTQCYVWFGMSLDPSADIVSMLLKLGAEVKKENWGKLGDLELTRTPSSSRLSNPKPLRTQMWTPQRGDEKTR